MVSLYHLGTNYSRNRARVYCAIPPLQRPSVADMYISVGDWLKALGLPESYVQQFEQNGFESLKQVCTSVRLKGTFCYGQYYLIALLFSYNRKIVVDVRVSVGVIRTPRGVDWHRMTWTRYRSPIHCTGIACAKMNSITRSNRWRDAVAFSWSPQTLCPIAVTDLTHMGTHEPTTNAIDIGNIRRSTCQAACSNTIVSTSSLECGLWHSYADDTCFGMYVRCD